MIVKIIQQWNGSGYEDTTFEQLPVGKNIMIKIVEREEIKKHNWQWYMNGTFCGTCGVQIGSDQQCR